MATRMARRFLAGLDGLRYEPTAKRIRAELDGATALDSTRALLVWEPQRVVPQYAVPAADVRGDLVAAPGAGDRHGPGPVPLGSGGQQVLTPATGFGVHTSAGEVLTVRLGDQERPGSAFRPADPDLDGYVVLDFAAFGPWFEEDEQVLSHPRDPFHRIDVRRSSRRVRIEHRGRVLAESTRPSLLFETHLPVRYYLPAEDVATDLLRRSDRVTSCAYKGVASYWSLDDLPDVAWTYPDPLPDAVQIKDLVSFFTERVDVVLDGVPQQRDISPWS
ncbi:DUF427 domain-containing protein [Pseudonocardia hispaniensis]|uniref:DUF427 domain-containing protein n=1 Tax=Pseudonocardia hispaniensis TaxID=904933 RepID=A0ABW1J324_9PSEU